MLLVLCGLLVVAFFSGMLVQWVRSSADRRLLRQYRRREQELQRLSRPIE
jgi:hypothetical protein